MTKRREVTSIQAWAVRIDRTVTEEISGSGSGSEASDRSGTAAGGGGGPRLMPDWEMRVDAA